jgi:hypothetical protein
LSSKFPSYINQSIGGIDASKLIQVPCSNTDRKTSCGRETFALYEASAVLDNVRLLSSTVGKKVITVVADLIPNNFLSPPVFVFTTMTLAVTQGVPIRVIYYWEKNSCAGPALCTAALSTNCSNIIVAVSSTDFIMPDIALKYLDAGNNLLDVLSTRVAPNNQQVFLNTSLQPNSTCRVPTKYPRFASDRSADGKTILKDEFFPYFELSQPNLRSLSSFLNSNRLIAGSRFIITMNGNTFKSGSDSISNVENNILYMNIVHGNTTVLAVVDDDWNSRVSTLNVSLGSLRVNAFDASCNVNALETSAFSLLLYYGEQNTCSGNSTDPIYTFFGHQPSSRFASGVYNTSSLHLVKPKSGSYYFCFCTGNSLCTSKSFQIIPGAPVDLVLMNISLASSFDQFGTGLTCNPSASAECGSNANIVFVASAFDVNENRVVYSNYSFTVVVQSPSGIIEPVVLWDYSSEKTQDQDISTNIVNSSITLPYCSLSSLKCSIFLAGVRGSVYSLKISLADAGMAPFSGQLVSQRMYTLSPEPIPLANYSLRDTLKPAFSASSSVLSSKVSKTIVAQSAPSLSIDSFRIAPCPSVGQVQTFDLIQSGKRNDNKFGRCQCARGFQQNQPPNIAETGRGFGDTISCSLCPEDTYQSDTGGPVSSCKSCQIAGVTNLPSSTLGAVGQTSLSACKCAPNSLYVRIAKLPTKFIDVTEVCLGLYNATAPKDCFCIRCDEKKQVCLGGSRFVPLTAGSSNGTGTASSSSEPIASQALSYWSFFNNSAYYKFLANTSSLMTTSSPMIPFYNLSSAAMACKVRGDGKFSCLTRPVYDGSQCEKGYTGFLCSSCALYASERFEKSSGNTCILCEEKDDNLSRFLFFLFILAILSVCLYFIREARKPQSVKNKFSVGTKTFLNHLQVISFMGDLQSQWTGLVRSMFNIANLSNLGFSIGNVGCTVGLTFQRKLILYCMSPFIISMVPMLIYVVESLVCFRKLYLDTKRRLRLAKSHQDHAALLNIDKGFDLDYIQSRYALEETELLYLSLTWKEHLRVFKKTLVEREDITTEEAINMRYELGKSLLKKQCWTDSVVVLMVVTFLLFSTISRQIFYTFSVRLCVSCPFATQLANISRLLGISLTCSTPMQRSTLFRSWSRSLTYSQTPKITKKLGYMLSFSCFFIASFCPLPSFCC